MSNRFLDAIARVIRDTWLSFRLMGFIYLNDALRPLPILEPHMSSQDARNHLLTENFVLLQEKAESQ